jgi:hypothetical protein
VNAPATLTVVTGPPGADIGPFTAWLGRDLADGLAIRTVDTAHGAQRVGYGLHTSPPGVPVRDRSTGDQIRALALSAVPSAHQDPQTNLGVAFSGQIDRRLAHDLEGLDAFWLAPHHRLTVQPGRAVRGISPTAELVPPPVEVGDLAVQARDAVLRGSPDGSRHVLIEAGEGQTLLDALHTVGLSPWAPYVEHLDLWVMVDAARPCGPSGRIDPADADPGRLADLLGEWAGYWVAANGGGLARQGYAPAMWLAVRNIQAVLPDLSGVTDAEFSDTDGEPSSWRVSEPMAAQLEILLIALERRAQCALGAVGTGPEADAPWLDLRGNR